MKSLIQDVQSSTYLVVMDEEKRLRIVEADALKDLQERMAALRARMVAAGRDAAVEALDKAIAREARATAKDGGKK